MGAPPGALLCARRPLKPRCARPACASDQHSRAGAPPTTAPLLLTSPPLPFDLRSAMEGLLRRLGAGLGLGGPGGSRVRVSGAAHSARSRPRAPVQGHARTWHAAGWRMQLLHPASQKDGWQAGLHAQLRGLGHFVAAKPALREQQRRAADRCPALRRPAPLSPGHHGAAQGRGRRDGAAGGVGAPVFYLTSSFDLTRWPAPLNISRLVRASRLVCACSFLQPCGWLAAG